MKYVWRIAFLGVLLSPMARAEVTIIKSNASNLRAFENFDNHIQALEDYSVYYREGSDKRKYVVMKSGSARQQKPDDRLNVELLPKKRNPS